MVVIKRNMKHNGRKCKTVLVLKTYKHIKNPEAIKTWGNGGEDTFILNHSTRWRPVLSFMVQVIYPQGMGPWYPLNRRLDGLLSVCTWWKKEKLLPLWKIEPQLTQPIASHFTH